MLPKPLKTQEDVIKNMYYQTKQLIKIQNKKKQESWHKLQYNLKKLLENLPQQLLNMKSQELINNYGGDIDKAALDKILLSKQQSFHSPPKVQRKKRIIKKK